MIAGSMLVAKLRGNFGQQLCRQGWFNRSVPKFPCSEIICKHYVNVKSSHTEHADSVAGKGICGGGERSFLLHLGLGEGGTPAFVSCHPTFR